VTESDWLSSTDPQAMLAFLRDRGPVSERKLQLFAVACCRDVLNIIDELEAAGIGLGRPAVMAAERLADGLATPAEVLRGVDDYVGLIDSGSSRESQLLGGALPALARPAWDAAILASRHTNRARYREAESRGMRRRGERGLPLEESTAEAVAAAAPMPARHCAFVRDIFSASFRPVDFDPSWRTESVVALARGVYEERAFERLPVLGDALEDAGCSDEVVLAHCRKYGAHVRGCLVVDSVLGLV
jgi:hypothetical protein